MGSSLCSVQLFTFITMPYIVSMWFLIALCLQATLATPMGGGKCETTADCVAPNVCSKWGWCQWTKIYGEDGPSQGASAPAGGRAGQCKTSADCASRVPYCSKLGFCNGGGATRRNNGNRQNNAGNGRKSSGNGRKNAGNGRKNNQSQARRQSNQQRRKPSNKKTSTSGGKECPGGSV